MATLLPAYHLTGRHAATIIAIAITLLHPSRAFVSLPDDYC